MESTTKNPILSNRVYDFLSWVVVIALPALGALYFGLAQIWGLPYAEEVVGTITIVATFLGTLLKVSASQHKQKQLATAPADLIVDGDDVYLALETPPSELPTDGIINVAVRKAQY